MITRRMLGAWVAAGAIGMMAACAQSDPGITTAVKTKLAADDTVKAYRIDVDTKEGVVTLLGTVDTPAAKTRAVEVARGTDGVRNVVDQLTVSAGVTPTTGLDDAAQQRAAEAARGAGAAADSAGESTEDAALTAKVKTKFLADTAIAGLRIDVDTKNNVVTLTGVVPSAAEKTRAVQVARGTDGVKSVVDNLTVGR